MYIAIARFPAVPAERDRDFRDWFAWSNDQLRGMAGLRGRRLLRASDGSYTALVEHESASTFAAMSAAEAVSMIHEGLGKILSDRPQAMTYDVVVDFSPTDFSTTETCCGPGKGTGTRDGDVPAQGSCTSQASCTCCHNDHPHRDDDSDAGGMSHEPGRRLSLIG